MSAQLDPTSTTNPDKPTRTLRSWDRLIPGMDEVLSATALCNRLAPHWQIIEAQVRYVRYKPSSQLVAGIRATDSTGCPRWIQALAYGPGAGDGVVDKLRKSTEKAAQRNELGDGVVVDESAAIVLSTDVCDRKLPGIRRSLFRHSSPGSIPESVLAYKPGRRWVWKTPSPQPRFVKVHRPRVSLVTAERHQVWQRAGLPVPTLRRLATRSGVVELSWEPGRAVSEFSDRSGWAEAGRQLVRAQATATHSVPVHMAPFDRRSYLRTSVQAITHVAPHFARKASALATRLEGRLPSRSCCLCHGDFSSDQVLVQPDGTVTFVDLDRSSLDHPMADIASWAAAEAVAGHPTQDSASMMAAPLVEGYTEAGGSIDTAAVEVLAATALLGRVVEPLRRGHPDWDEQLERLLGLAYQWSENAS